jgi:osmoprotectant transport system permease protein
MKKLKESKTYGPIIRIFPYVILVIYVAAVLLLFLAELKQFGLEKKFRATDQVLILLALLILPFIVLGMSTFIRSLKMKISGQELEIVLDDFKSDIRYNITKMEVNIKGNLSTSERALWPILAGYNVKQEERLKNNKVIIGAKEDVSQIFFANLLSRAIHKLTAGKVSCQLKLPNEGSVKNFADVRFGWIDMYIDFTGTCCQYFNIDHHKDDDGMKSDEEIIKDLNDYGSALGIKWLKPLGASEDYCLVMKKKNAEERKIRKIEDLIENGRDMVFSADPEFINRDDCYVGMKNYGINFKTIIPCEITNRYEYMESDEADIFVGYETDPELGRSDIIKLDDPQHFFPKYMAVPLVNQKALNTIEGLESALEKLGGIMNTKDLVQAVNLLSNYRIISDNDPKNPVNKILEKL